MGCATKREAELVCTVRVVGLNRESRGLFSHSGFSVTEAEMLWSASEDEPCCRYDGSMRRYLFLRSKIESTMFVGHREMAVQKLLIHRGEMREYGFDQRLEGSLASIKNPATQ